MDGYGKCGCGGELRPIWFREKEYRRMGGAMVATGRTRLAVSCLTCSSCMKDVAVDDSFDGPWEG